MNSYSPHKYVIVNADDYAYFNCVSRGILKAAMDGIVTATGILANSEHFDEHVAWLKDYQKLDLGVHLNLTHGSPLTLGKKNGLGCFPKKHTLFKAVLSGALKPKEVKLEWRAQIERCLEKGLNLKFLNSHQHIHMLPSLFSVTLELAETYRIPHIRISVPERLHHSTSGILARDSIMILLGLLNHHKLKSQEPLFLGMAESGKLGSASMALQFRKLKSGHIYELMCHPGLCNPDEIKDPRLLRYHDWNKEFNAVAVPGLKARFLQQGIRFIGYRDIEFLKDRVPALTVNNLN